MPEQQAGERREMEIRHGNHGGKLNGVYG